MKKYILDGKKEQETINTKIQENDIEIKFILYTEIIILLC